MRRSLFLRDPKDRRRARKPRFAVEVLWEARTTRGRGEGATGLGLGDLRPAAVPAPSNETYPSPLGESGSCNLSRGFV